MPSKYRASRLLRPIDSFLWNVNKTESGYGVVGRNGKTWIASRYAWFLYRGDIPHGMCVCHTCDNPRCVNPEHLFLGTNQDNVNDKMRKGRMKPNNGEANGRAKLTAKQVNDIRSRSNDSSCHLAREFGVSKTQILWIRNNKSWVTALDK